MTTYDQWKADDSLWFRPEAGHPDEEQEMANELVKTESTSLATEPLRVDDVIHQLDLVRSLMSRAMVDGQDFGRIPGTPKPSLYQPGAEKLALMFRLAPTYTYVVDDNAYFSVTVTCVLHHIPTGNMVGSAVALCNNNEDGDYRRNKETDEYEYEPRPRNTIVQMACKRAFVKAVRSCTAASMIFTSDVEDFIPKQPKASPARPAAPHPKTSKLSPNDLATVEQRGMLWATLRQHLGDDGAASWLAKEMARLNLHNKNELRVRHISELIEKVMGQVNEPDPAALSDEEQAAIVEAFDATREQ